MQCGREIELSFNGVDYYITPNYEWCNENWNDTEPPYPNSVLYSCEKNGKLKLIFDGSTEEVICFKFDDRYTLKDYFDLFSINFVL